jgi:hypothetical protein
MINRRAFVMTGIGAAALLSHRPAAAVDATVGKPAPNFAIADTKGQIRKLEEFRGKTVVFEWTSSSCPFVAAHYKEGDMQALQRWATTERNAVWLSVLSTNASRRDYMAPAQAEAFEAQRKASPTAILMDPEGKLGRTYGARTTPHMYVVAADGMLVYAGAIDDQPTYDPAVVKKSKNLVRAALEDIQAGRPVTVSSTRAYGCTIGYGS